MKTHLNNEVMPFSTSSLSLSSNDSDDGPAHRPNSGHGHSHASDGGGGAGQDYVDGFSPTSAKNRPRSSSSVATGRMAEYHSHGHAHHVGHHAHGHVHVGGRDHQQMMHSPHGRSVFKTPEKLMPRYGKPAHLCFGLNNNFACVDY